MAVEAPSLVKYEGLGVTTPEEILKREHPRFYKREHLITPDLVPNVDMGTQEGFQLPRSVNRYLLSFRNGDGKLGHLAVPDAISPPILKSFVAQIPNEQNQIYFQNQVLFCPSALDLMIKLNMGLVYEFALKRFASIKGTTLTLDDLIIVGKEGLVRAIETFDLDKRVKGKVIQFSTHATWWIMANINRIIQEERNLLYVPVHAQAKISHAKKIEALLAQRLDRDPTDEEVHQALQEAGMKGVVLEYLLNERQHRFKTISLDRKDDNDQSLYDKLIETEKATTPSREHQRAVELVEYALSQLPHPLGEIVQLREGLGGGPHYTLQEIATLLDLPLSRVKKLSGEANRRIREILQGVY